MCRFERVAKYRPIAREFSAGGALSAGLAQRCPGGAFFDTEPLGKESSLVKELGRIATAAAEVRDETHDE